MLAGFVGTALRSAFSDCWWERRFQSSAFLQMLRAEPCLATERLPRTLQAVTSRSSVAFGDVSAPGIARATRTELPHHLPAIDALRRVAHPSSLLLHLTPAALSAPSLPHRAQTSRARHARPEPWASTRAPAR